MVDLRGGDNHRGAFWHKPHWYFCSICESSIAVDDEILEEITLDVGGWPEQRMCVCPKCRDISEKYLKLKNKVEGWKMKRQMAIDDDEKFRKLYFRK